MDTSIYQIICDGITSMNLPSWKKIVFLAMYTDDSYEMKFYVRINEEYKDCFSLGIPIKDVVSMFSKLDKDILLHRNNMKQFESEKWNSMTLSFSRTGEFHVDYDYDNTSVDFIAYIEAWKAKHLL